MGLSYYLCPWHAMVHAPAFATVQGATTKIESKSGTVPVTELLGTLKSVIVGLSILVWALAAQLCFAETQVSLGAELARAAEDAGYELEYASGELQAEVAEVQVEPNPARPLRRLLRRFNYSVAPDAEDVLTVRITGLARPTRALTASSKVAASAKASAEPAVGATESAAIRMTTSDGIEEIVNGLTDSTDNSASREGKFRESVTSDGLVEMVRVREPGNAERKKPGRYLRSSTSDGIEEVVIFEEEPVEPEQATDSN